MSYVKTISLDSGDIAPVITDFKYPIEDFTSLEHMFNELERNFLSVRFRIFVLYPDETIQYEIPESDIKIGGSYSENYQNGQRRTLSFSLYNEDGRYTPNINKFWAGTRLALEAGIQLASGSIIWFRKGVFVISSISTSYQPGNKEVQIEASDKFAIFEGNTGKLEGTFTVPVGTNIKDLIRTILMTEMGDGEIMDYKDFIYPEVFEGKETQVEITQEAGSTYGQILLDIATQLSAEIFYNSNGNLVFQPIDEVTLDNYKGSLGHFSAESGDISGLDFSFDYNNIINRVVVQGQSSAGNVYRAEAKNENPASPLCCSRIGLRTATVSDSAIYNDMVAQERADYELRQYTLLKTNSSASVLFNPLLTVNNIIRISDEYYNLIGEKFLLQSVSFSIDYSNQMQISFNNLHDLPFLVNTTD